MSARSAPVLAFGLFAAAAMLFAQPHASSASDVASKAPAGASDRALQLIGKWSCTSAAGSVGTLTYTQGSDNTLTMVNTFIASDGKPGEFDETFRFDPVSAQWTWKSRYVTDGSLEEGGSAAPWVTADWTFEGSLERKDIPPAESIAQPRFSKAPVRMIYRETSPTTFLRMFQIFSNGGWATFSSSACARESEPAPSQ